jgi:malonyl-CoA O-methyltransferase
MLAATKARLGCCPSLETQLMDGEQPTLGNGQWDVICSNLAVQWFVDLGAGLRRLYQALAPGGLLAVTTLGRQSFAPWAAACQTEGITPFSQRYPSQDDLSALCPGAEVSSQLWPLGTADGQNAAACLAALRAIGADTPPPGQDRAAPVALRRALRRLAGQGIGGYQVLTLLWAKADCSAEEV